MISLYHDPSGENVLTSHNLTSPFLTNTTTSESPEESISGLQARIKELESMLFTKEVNI